MSASDQLSGPPRAKRLRTDLACDTCRQRKSRCDGRKPSCTHCEHSGLVCTYRVPASTVESDSSVMTRLADVEARMQALEAQSTAATHSPGLPLALRSADGDLDYALVPDFHTAAGHKIVQYWSRLRVKLTIPKLHPFTYLKEADQADKTLIPGAHQRDLDLDLPSALSFVDKFFERTDDLPVALVELVVTSSKFTKANMLESLYRAVYHRQGQASAINFSLCPIEVLLVVAVGCRFDNIVDQDGLHRPSLSESYFAAALRNMWRLSAESEDYALTVKLFVAQLFIYYFSRPFHALGLLQEIGPAIDRMERKALNDPLLQQQRCVFTRLHYLLESDILTELDGIPSVRLLHSFYASSTASNALPTDHYPGSLTAPIVNTESHTFYLKANLWLRARLNRILFLYTTHKAYAHPEEIGPFVAELGRQLDTWYRLLPLDLQFARDAASFRLAGSKTPLRVRELAIRYYTCIFLLNRVVLYYVLYQDIETAATPSEYSHPSQDMRPWVFESCRSCLQAATLIMLSHVQRVGNLSVAAPADCFNWCGIQLVAASWAVLLQAQSMGTLTPIVQDIGELDSLMDTAEGYLEAAGRTALGVQRTLEVLINLRQNFVEVQ